MTSYEIFKAVVDTIHRLDPEGVSGWHRVLWIDETAGLKSATVNDLPALAGHAYRAAFRMAPPGEGSGLSPSLYFKVGYDLVMRYGKPEVRVMADREFGDGTIAKGGYEYPDVPTEADRLAATLRRELIAQLAEVA